MGFFKKDQKKNRQALRDLIPFDPQTQYVVILSSICTGEKLAGFKDRSGVHFTEVMLIKSDDDEKEFREIYGLDEIKKEY